MSYIFEIPGEGIVLEADRLRRDRHELIGELTVRCALPGARLVNGCLATGDFNFSSVRARQDRAKLLAMRANTNGELDWFALLEDFCQRVFQDERDGDPAVDLRTMPRPERDDEIRVDGLVFPKRHPSILFGDGGAAKSYTALYIGGTLAQRGLTVALFDWELCGEDHRDRLERLFGPIMPKVLYCRCERPLIHEADRLRRVAKDHHVDYALFDSVAFACDGPPESAEIAGKYFRAIREIPCGSLHVAHINRSETSDAKPFGSAFWHNGARSTWFCQAGEPANNELRLGFFNRKCNLGALYPPASFRVTFGSDRTAFERANIADDPDLAMKMNLRQRMIALLKHGSMPIDDVAEELDANRDTVSRTARRYRDAFVLLDGGRVCLKAVGI